MSKTFPFGKDEHGNVIWTLSDGKEVVLGWEEFKQMVKSEEYIVLPKKEFEEYYKRLKHPRSVRKYLREKMRKKKLKE